MENGARGRSERNKDSRDSRGHSSTIVSASSRFFFFFLTFLKIFASRLDAEPKTERWSTCLGNVGSGLLPYDTGIKLMILRRRQLENQLSNPSRIYERYTHIYPVSYMIDLKGERLNVHYCLFTTHPTSTSLSKTRLNCSLFPNNQGPTYAGRKLWNFSGRIIQNFFDVGICHVSLKKRKKKKEKKSQVCCKCNYKPLSPIMYACMHT